MYLLQPSTGCIKQLLFSSIYLFQQGKPLTKSAAAHGGLTKHLANFG